MKHFWTFLAVAVLATAFSACADKQEDQAQTEPQQTELAANMVVDPVCDMKVNKEETQFTSEYEGKTYYFCMETHKAEFVAHPEKYVAGH